MAAALHDVNLPPEILARGFWVYIWKITGPCDEKFCYVGMTGDRSGVAQSPFNRASSHFGSNKNANQIRRALADRGVSPESCKGIRFLVYGPILPYDHSVPNHADFHPSRRSVASLERRLWEEADSAGYVMLNIKPDLGSVLDEGMWRAIREAFQPHLNSVT